MPRPPKSETPLPNKLPKPYLRFQKRYPRVAQAYEELGMAAHDAGPLEGKTLALVKLGIAAGAQLEGGVHSHTRRAIEAGCTPDEVRHVVLLAITTLGLPSMMKTLCWVEDVLSPEK